MKDRFPSSGGQKPPGGCHANRPKCRETARPKARQDSPRSHAARPRILLLPGGVVGSVELIRRKSEQNPWIRGCLLPAAIAGQGPLSRFYARGDLKRSERELRWQRERRCFWHFHDLPLRSPVRPGYGSIRLPPQRFPAEPSEKSGIGCR